MNYIDQDILLGQGFVPWMDKELSGYYRRVTFKKTGLMGPVAEYFADDYIVTKHNDSKSVQRLLAEVKGISDVVTQRFLLVGYADESIKSKTFLLGLKGWLKIRGCTASSDKSCKAFSDLLYIVLGKD